MNIHDNLIAITRTESKDILNKLREGKKAFVIREGKPVGVGEKFTAKSYQKFMEKSSMIKLDIKLGDILLGGRFKNKRMKVKKISEDELGQPTVNGQKLLAVRIEKELPKDKMSSKTKEEMKKESSMDWLEKIAQEAFEDEIEKMALSRNLLKRVQTQLTGKSKGILKSTIRENAKEALSDRTLTVDYVTNKLKKLKKIDPNWSLDVAKRG